MKYDPEAEAIDNIATGLHRIADALYSLGNGNVNGAGAIEGHSICLRDEVAPLIAEALSEGLQAIAQAVNDAASDLQPVRVGGGDMPQEVLDAAIERGRKLTGETDE